MVGGNVAQTEVIKIGSKDVESQRCSISPFPYPIRMHASSVTPAGIVVCGGLGGNRTQCKILSKSNDWTNFPSLSRSKGRYLFDMRYMNGKLWAIAGYVNLGVIDANNPTKWTQFYSAYAGYAHCVTEIDENRLIVTGGNLAYGDVSIVLNVVSASKGTI